MYVRIGRVSDMAERLRDYMAQFGEIDQCTIMRDPSGRSRGFGFLTYASAESVRKVLAKTHQLDGKQVHISPLSIHRKVATCKSAISCTLLYAR